MKYHGTLFVACILMWTSIIISTDNKQIQSKLRIAETEDEERLVKAALEGRSAVVKELLDKGIFVDVRTGYYKETALMLTPYRHAEIVKMLLEAGADPNAQSCDGRTPLHRAAVYPEIVKLLLAAKAKVDIPENNGQTVFQLISIIYSSMFCDPSSNEEVALLLINHGAAIRDQKGSEAFAKRIIANPQSDMVDGVIRCRPPMPSILSCWAPIASGVETIRRNSNDDGSLHISSSDNECLEKFVRFCEPNFNYQQMTHRRCYETELSCSTHFLVARGKTPYGSLRPMRYAMTKKKQLQDDNSSKEASGMTELLKELPSSKKAFSKKYLVSVIMH